MSHASWAAGCTAVDGTRLVDDEPSRRRVAPPTRYSPARIRPDRDRACRIEASPAAGDPESDRPESDRQQPEPHAEELQDPSQVLRGFELVRLHDLDPAGVGTEPLRDIADDSPPGPRAGSRAAGGRARRSRSRCFNGPMSSSRTLISCLCACVTVVHPERLHPRALEHPLRRPGRRTPAARPPWARPALSDRRASVCSSAAATSMFAYSESTSEAAT